MKNFFYCFLFLISLCSSSQAIAQCNGFTTLCQRRFNEVAYLTTHNAFNCQENNFSLPNQTWGITKQLQDGVRGLMIDVYESGGTLTVYHGSSFLGSELLSDILEEIKTYLDSNSNEVISIIFESYTSASSIENALAQSGLSGYLFEKLQGEPWPVLQEMIDSGKRLVIFSEKNDGSSAQPWYHFIWDHAVETHFTVHDTADFSCNFNRGDSANALFILNHFITNLIGVGVPAQAEIANSNPYFINRAVECWQTHNKFPNFVAVDFYEKGQCKDVVNALNDMLPVSEHSGKKYMVLQCRPNPAEDLINIDIPESFTRPFMLCMYQVSGVPVYMNKRCDSFNCTLNISGLPTGIYTIALYDSRGRMGYALVVKK